MIADIMDRSVQRQSPEDEGYMVKISQRWLKVGALTLMLGASGQAFSAAKVSEGDPWEGFNRATYRFNDTVDAWVLKPVAQGYDTVTPEPIQDVVSNFFRNLSEFRNIANSLLQFRLKEAGESAGRLVVNSTVGMLGMLDVASGMGLDYHYQDFGLTLAQWNVPSGPYVVVPLLGPRTVRSAAGIYPDMQASPITHIHDSRDQLITQTSDLVSLRASLLKQELLIVGDEYTFVRDAYLQRRDFLITGELPEDDF
ncbi:VacJ family lipoprotein [Sansalvadorimonas sp. 2012CJ34-2]|uniref:VacJ family lipoprotein n=1 Tax=Parendozoicomonas callyspongiae TaxID=2942213 RepID=A0ABT0PL43_9GAMM|nr:VacJ family lipoprotein [Sansalvadorimonas sp. 2012CJ34-2]MCL6272102.1 VacJ family lipoprotein [Sansalvadorimonas sp. 2012CJ34-2]